MGSEFGKWKVELDWALTQFNSKPITYNYCIFLNYMAPFSI